MIIYCSSYAYDIMIWITSSSDLHSDKTTTTTTTTTLRCAVERAGKGTSEHIIYDLLLVELFDVEYYRGLEMLIRGHSRSMKLVPFESSGVVSYSPSVLTMALILYRLRDMARYWSKIAKFLCATCI